jgi:hypothetical protein
MEDKMSDEPKKQSELASEGEEQLDEKALDQVAGGGMVGSVDPDRKIIVTVQLKPPPPVQH